MIIITDTKMTQDIQVLEHLHLYILFWEENPQNVERG